MFLIYSFTKKLILKLLLLLSLYFAVQTKMYMRNYLEVHKNVFIYLWNKKKKNYNNNIMRKKLKSDIIFVTNEEH